MINLRLDDKDMFTFDETVPAVGIYSYREQGNGIKYNQAANLVFANKKQIEQLYIALKLLLEEISDDYGKPND